MVSAASTCAMLHKTTASAVSVYCTVVSAFYLTMHSTLTAVALSSVTVCAEQCYIQNCRTVGTFELPTQSGTFHFISCEHLLLPCRTASKVVYAAISSFYSLANSNA